MSTAQLEYINTWSANVTQQTDITVLGEDFTPGQIDVDKLITINVTPVELKHCLGYSSKWNPLATDAEGQQEFPDIVLRLASVLGYKLDRVHTDLMSKTGLAANSRTFKDDVNNDISTFARVFLQEVQFTGSVFDTDIPKVAVRSIDEQPAVATSITDTVGNITSVGASSTVVTALRSLFEQAVAANRVKNEGAVDVDGAYGYKTVSFVEGDSLTIYIDYSFIKTRSYTVDGNVTSGSVRSAIVSLQIGNQVFNVNTATTETSNTLTKRYAFKFVASATKGRWDLTNLLTSLWAKTFTSSGASQGIFTQMDSLGNVYVSGFYTHTGSNISLGNNVSLPWGTGNNDVFLIKYNSSGVAQWAKTINGNSGSNDQGLSIAIDSLDNVYLSGSYSIIGAGPVITLAPGITLGATNGTVAGFVVKYNSFGDAQWAKTIIHSSGSQLCRGITTDSSNNVYVCGSYSTNTKIILGPASSNPTVSEINLPVTQSAPSTGINGFLIKYDTTGVAQFAKTFPGTGSDIMYSVALDSSGNIYIGGNYTSSSQVTLENNVILPITAGATPGADGCLIKYNSEGVPQWAKTVRGTGTETGWSVATDSSGNVFFAGVYNSSGQVDLGDNKSLPSTAGNDGFLIKYNASGDPIWANNIKASGSDESKRVRTDALGNVYISGEYSSSSTLSLTNGVSLPATNGTDAFVIKYDSNGIPQWANTVKGGFTDVSLGLAVSPLGKTIYLAGWYINNTSNSATPITITDVNESKTLISSSNVLPTFTANGTSKIFLIKYSQ